MKRKYLYFCLILIFLQLGQIAEASDISAPYRRGNWEIYGDGPHLVDIGIGAFDADEKKSAAARVELRFGKKLFFFGPALGVLASTDDIYFGYGGIYADIAYRRLVITPLGGVGGYERGDGRDLGGIFQFRTSITLSWLFDNRARLGVQAGHISNAGTHDSNSSEQDLFLTFAFPF